MVWAGPDRRPEQGGLFSVPFVNQPEPLGTARAARPRGSPPHSSLTAGMAEKAPALNMTAKVTAVRDLQANVLHKFRSQAHTIAAHGAVVT